MSYLARPSKASQMMYELVEERMGEFGLGAEHTTSFDDNKADVFCLLYSKNKPEIIVSDDTSKRLAAVSDCEAFGVMREIAILDPVVSGLCMNAIIDALHLSKGFKEAEEGELDQKDLENLEELLRSGLEEITIIDEIISDTEGSIANGLGIGGGSPGEIGVDLSPDHSVDVKTMTEKRLRVAGVLKNNANLQTLFAAFGRLKDIEHEALDETISSSSDSTALDLGSEIDKADTGYLVTRPIEIIAQDLADGTIEQVSGDAPGGLGSGPVVILVDISGSMGVAVAGSDNETRTRFQDLAIATAFSLAEQCRRMERPFSITPFNHLVNENREVFSDAAGKAPIEDLEAFLSIHNHGGTAFHTAVSDGMIPALDRGGMENADVIFITDGCTEAIDNSAHVFDKFIKVKDSLDSNGTRVFVLNFGQAGYCMRILAGAGPAQMKRDPLASNIPVQNKHKSRLFENLELEAKANDGIKTVLREVAERASHLDWLDN